MHNIGEIKKSERWINNIVLIILIVHHHDKIDDLPTNTKKVSSDSSLTLIHRRGVLDFLFQDEPNPWSENLAPGGPGL